MCALGKMENRFNRVGKLEMTEEIPLRNAVSSKGAPS